MEDEHIDDSVKESQVSFILQRKLVSSLKCRYDSKHPFL